MESHCFSLVVVFLYDRIAMLLREMLTLSILAERFILARKTSAANLSSQTRDMASNCINSINDYGDNVGSGWRQKDTWDEPWLPSLWLKALPGNSFRLLRQASSSQSNISRTRSRGYWCWTEASPKSGAPVHSLTSSRQQNKSRVPKVKGPNCSISF